MKHTSQLGSHSFAPRRSALAVTAAAAAGVVLLGGCGSSGGGSGSAVAADSRPATPAVSPSFSSSVEPTVGPTDPAQTPAPQPAVIDLQVVQQDGATIVIAPVVIKGRTYKFVVDTGATVTLISKSFAQQIGLKQTTEESVPLAGIGGQSKAYLANISDWRIGRAKVPTSTVAVADLQLRGGLVGLLGSDVMSTFGKITIDYKGEKATLG